MLTPWRHIRAQRLWAYLGSSAVSFAIDGSGAPEPKVAFTTTFFNGCEYYRPVFVPSRLAWCGARKQPSADGRRRSTEGGHQIADRLVTARSVGT
jgi:hypothetical protein